MPLNVTNIRFTIAIALPLTTTALNAVGVRVLAIRQECTIDCAYLDQNRSRFWEATERCYRPNGSEPDIPVWPTLSSVSPALLEQKVEC